MHDTACPHTFSFGGTCTPRDWHLGVQAKIWEYNFWKSVTGVHTSMASRLIHGNSLYQSSWKILTLGVFSCRKLTCICLSLQLYCRLYCYRKNSMYWDRKVSANSADQDQTASEEAVWSGSTLFAIPSASFGSINAMLHQTFLFLRTIMAIVWGVPNFRIFTVG